ncbi:MAG: hypothetical protein L3J93_00865 [Thermoplasmata archaeon]|nr:hypothetical protein [Thermoplasmata archaeon]
MSYSSPPAGQPTPAPPPPPYGALWGSGWPGPPGSGTADAVRELRRSITYYEIYLVISILITLVAVALLGSVVFGSAGSLLGPVSMGRMTVPTPNPGAAIAAAVLSVTFAIAGFIILVLAWSTWLGGSNKLARHAGEFGPQAAEAARRARSDWTVTTALFFVNIIVGVVFVVVLVFEIVSSLAPVSNTTTTTSAPTVDFSQFVGLVVGVVLISALLAFLLYWFATRGLVGGLGGIAPQEIRTEAETARTIILLGAILSVAGAAGYLVPPVRLVALVSPVVLLYGFWRLGGAYDRWLAHPPAPGLPRPLAPDTVRTYG